MKGKANEEFKRLTFWRNQINDNLKGSSLIENRLIGIEVLPRLLARIEKNKVDCKLCNASYNEATHFVDLIKVVVSSDNKMKRKEFETFTKKMFKHLSKEHHQFPKGRIFSNILGLIMLTCMIIGIIVGYMFKLNILSGFLLGWAGGLILGYVTGKIVERNLAKKGQLF